VGWGEEVSAADGQKLWAELRSLAPALISKRGNRPNGCIPHWGFTGVGLASARLTFGFAKTCRTGGTSASLSSGRIWRRKPFREAARSSLRGCVRVHAGRIRFLCARGSLALPRTCYRGEKTPFPGGLLCRCPGSAAPSPTATCAKAPSVNHQRGLSLLFPHGHPCPEVQGVGGCSGLMAVMA